MSTKVAEIQHEFGQDKDSAWVSQLWDKFNNQRREKIEEWKELRNYLFATDTSTTSNQSLPWKNSTTLPKLCQIRDNLHSNYMSALFPNDNWLRWEGYSREDSVKEKASAIQAYISNKARDGGLRGVVSQGLYDYIDYGNAFSTAGFESKSKELEDGTYIPTFIGPKAIRISPLDIVFNPLANSFEETFKIVRSTKSLGEIQKMAMEEPENGFWTLALARREELMSKVGGYTIEDFDKAVGYQADGFGSMHEYFSSDYMEILEYFGDYRDQDGVLHTDRLITVVDRSHTVRNDMIPSWLGGAPIVHVGWRTRPDNLWAMGPLDNLVGMQYRIDHLENLKADAMDLIVHPPLKIIGEVEEFVWGPNAEIQIDENGDVVELGKGLNGILTADNQIEFLEARMELYAGAPREAMGIRTAGEKTAFEVQQLSNAAGRIFQEKITHFEIEYLEKLLNIMLESSKRNMQTADVIRVLDKEFNIQKFLTVTREDITASGKIRPVGARYFAKQAQDLQNLMGIFNSPIGQMIAPHTSAKQMAKVVEDVTGLSGYNLFSPNIAVREQQETQSMMQQSQSDLQAEAETINTQNMA